MSLRDYGFILLPTVLGFVAVYLLLPRVRQSRPAWGAAAGGLAVVLTGILLLHGTGIWPETLLFGSFAGIAVLGGVLLVTQSNPVYAALSFALVVLSTCGLFLLNGAPFLTAATIIIYAGAIVVTFLFVIMLGEQSGVDSADLRSREPFLASVAGFVLLASLLGVLHRTFDLRDLRELEALSHDLDRLRKAQDVQAVKDALGPIELKNMMPEQTKKLRRYLHEGDDQDRNFASQIEFARAQNNVADVRTWAGKAHQELELLRGRYGTVARRGVEKLPAENVAGLGKAMFTDYLVPVELAGVLLLVATIGAIAIAGRRGGEVLR